jgi:hypothetical protein
VPDIVAYALLLIKAMKLLRDNFQKAPEAFVRCILSSSKAGNNPEGKRGGRS